MAPSHSRQLLILTLPTIAAILSYYIWYKRKRIGDKTDPGETSSKVVVPKTKSQSQPNSPSKSKPTSTRVPCSSPAKFSRSLSGVDSAPIDIVIPPKLKSVKSNPIVISDEDLDFEIEKIKSMRYGGSIDIRKSSGDSSSGSNSENTKPKSVSPTKETPPKPVKKQTPVKKQSPKMAQKIEGAALAVPLKESSPKSVEKSPKNGHEELQRQNSGRDSANHSPADVMLASPSLSSISDNHSEGSNDSGKGGSDVVTPPPSGTIVTDIEDPNAITLYEFAIPQTLVGKLIGKRGSFVTMIKDKTGAHVVVRKNPNNNKSKLCVIEGNQKEIDSALKLIREKFPLKRFPEVTLERICYYPQVATVPLVPDHLYLKLIEGINNDTIVSCIDTPNHLFLQQPTHPTFPNFNILNSVINACYEGFDSPLMPTPVPENSICVAFLDSWYRALVLSTDSANDTSNVKLVDYGGYYVVPNRLLRQIRGDYVLCPFQAAECVLANIKPAGDEGWTPEAHKAVVELTQGRLVYTQIVDKTDEFPLVNCYIVTNPPEAICLNEELVNRGHAAWICGGEEEEEEAAGVSAE